MGQCIHCDIDLTNNGQRDVRICPWCAKVTPTGLEDQLRAQIEANYGGQHPKPEAARGISYASAIYKLASAGKGFALRKIERDIRKQFGREFAADHVSVDYTGGRSFNMHADASPGLAIIVLSGSFPVTWKYVYVVFRGSAGLAQWPLGLVNPGNSGRDQNGAAVDWLANFDNQQTAANWDNTVKVHRGFHNVYMSVRAVIAQRVANLMQDNITPTVFVAGHSLGSALATLCTHDLESSGICSPVLLSFCPPRVGDLQFANSFNLNIANQTVGLPAHGVELPRAYTFYQSGDPVSAGQTNAWLRNSARSTKIGNQGFLGNIVVKGQYVKHKTPDPCQIYYHVKNRVVTDGGGVIPHSHKRMKLALRHA